ncbi:MAG: DUF742 domain-containing protein [Actinomycetota bacterium]
MSERPGHDFVRPFIMTGGRTRAARRDLRLETMLHSAVAEPPPGLPSEQEELLALCQEPQSVAEAASKLGLVVGVVTVIAGDLIAEDLLTVHHTDPVEIELDVLTKMLDRVRAI